MMNCFFKLFTFFSLLFMLSSCGGDLFTKNVEDETKIEEFETCSMDLDVISKIMTKNVRRDLDCLEENLLLFIDLIKSEKPGSLDQKSLETYLKENEKDLGETTYNILSAMFDLSYLIFGDERGFISKENVVKLGQLLKRTNQLVVEGKVYDYFSSDELISYEEHNLRKSIIHNALVNLGQLYSKTIKKETVQHVDFVDLVEKFENDENKIHIDLFKKILFLKTALVGGKRNILSSLELNRLVSMLGDIGKVLYDVSNLPFTKTEPHEKEEVLKILSVDMETLSKNLFLTKFNRHSKLLTYSDITAAVSAFTPKLGRFFKYKRSFLKLKEILLGNSLEHFTIVDVKVFIDDVLLKILNKGVFSYRNYMANKSSLDEKTKKWRGFLDSRFITYGNEKSYIKDFNRIIKEYRFYQGDKESAFFGYKYERNPLGLAEIFMLEDVVGRFFRHYGTLDKGAIEGAYLNKNQLKNIMLDFKDFIEGEGFLLPNRAASTADTIMIMTSLFHAQSNGDSSIEVPEFVEFIITIRSAFEFAKKNQEFLEDKCPGDEKGRIETACFRNYIPEFLETKTDTGQRRGSFLPLLEKHFEELGSREKIEEYVISTTRFSRSCNLFSDGTEPPMRFGDFLVIWTGMFVVEQSMIKFDDNYSGILEIHEVNNAFDIYENAIRGLVPYDFLKKRDSFVFALFKYLVKYKRGPDFPKVVNTDSFIILMKQLGHLGYFYTRSQVPFNEEFINHTADRETFTSVLKVISESSPGSSEMVPYDCNFLR